MFGGLYRWTMGLAGHRHAVATLLGVTFAESFVFPVPADALMLPVVLAQRERAWRIATLATIASVARWQTSSSIATAPRARSVRVASRYVWTSPPRNE